MMGTLGTDPLPGLGTLRPGPGSTDRDLEEALTGLRSALAAGQAAESVLRGVHRELVLGRALKRDVGAAQLIDLEGLGAPFAADSEIPFTSHEIVSVRSSPIAELDPLAPDWTRAMKPSATRGPFINAVGEQFWIDAFLLPHLVSIEARTTPFSRPRLIARLSIRGIITSAPRVELAAGSVWLAARELVAGRPVEEFVGLRVGGGSLELHGVAGSSADTISLAGQWRVVLKLKLDPPPNLTPSDGPGADAANASVRLPDTVAFIFENGRPVIVQFAEAKATAWGSNVSLTRKTAAPFYDSISRAAVIPGDVSTPSFTFAQVRSDIWKIGETIPIVRSGWALPVAITSAQALGEAAGTGAIWLELGTAAKVSWVGLPKQVVAPKVILSLAPGTLTTWVSMNEAEAKQQLLLWEETGSDPPRRSNVEVTSAAGSLVIHLSQAGTDAVLFSGIATAHLDRPLVADGLRLRVRMPAGWLLFVQTAAGTTAGVVAADPHATSAPHVAFALENALLKVRPPAWLAVAGTLKNDALESGLLLLRFPHRATLPTLPDPYAANFEFDRRQDTDVGWASAIVGWPDPQRATISFTTEVPSQQVSGANDSLVAVGRARLDPLRVLLDVSSNADQFGVMLPERASSVLGMSLVARARDVAVMTLPPISWEPMLTKAPKPTDGDVALPPPPHDGGPATLRADTVDLKPVEPIPLLTTFHDAINKRRHFAARLPLSFGLTALVHTALEPNAGSESDFIPQGGAVFFNRPAFGADLHGGRQLALRGRGTLAADSMDPLMPGYAELCADNSYALGVLSTNLHTRFDGDFGHKNDPQPQPGVPLRRYDWSGYGASVFSDWRFPKAVGPAIVQVRFDVIVGRTAHEVVQMQSAIYPWYIRVVRTITMDRTKGGWVLREDSGWVPTSDGRFAYQDDLTGTPQVFAAFPATRVHPGVMDALVNVRNIRLDGAQFRLPTVKGSAVQTTWQPVRFDADVQFVVSSNPRLVVAGGSAGLRVPSRNITGWILIDGPTYDLPLGGGKVTRARPADAAQVSDLLSVTGPAIAPIDCGLALGGTEADPGILFRAAQITASCTDDTPKHLVAAVRGSPKLPRDGQWSIARIGATDAAPNALDPTFPVPVVRPNGPLNVAGRWHLADPRDILQLADGASPATRYGLVQSLGTQKVFFPRPRVGNDPDPITLPKPPQLADVGALLNAAGVFPALAEAFDFKNLKALSVANGEVGFTDTFEIPGNKQAVLADLGGTDGIQVLIGYADEHDPPKPTTATITVNPAVSPRWSLSLERVAFTVVFRGAPLIQIFASVRADELTAPTVHNLNVRYEGILGALQTIFTNIQQVARFLPGGKDAGVRVAFSQGQLTIRNAFALPKLPLGAGQITDITVDMGFDLALTPFDVRFVAGLGTSEKPFRWIVSPLAGTGVVRVGISPKGLDVLVQAGLGLGLAIDLGIASGAASVALAFEINTGPTPFEMRVILSGRASVDVLAGLASATITLAAGLGIIPPKELLQPPYLPPSLPPPNPIGPFTVGITASVAVGIHISVCWVVDVDWDGYWQFRQDIKTPAIPIPIF